MVDGSTALSAVTTGPNSSTVASSKYGTVQSDGRMYYYTDIKGSKPIKDPRIGAHFGSQRYRTSSLQKLEQETATHGEDVYSVDGRDWMRVVSPSVYALNSDDSEHIYQSAPTTANEFFEIVGYFNDANVLHKMATNGDYFKVTLDGGTTQSTDLAITFGTPIGARYVTCGSLINLTFNSTPSLGIHTLRFTMYSTSYYFMLHGFELIAQDTTSATTKSKIQIPAQNVVSYGKKFTVAATAHHYNPFAFAGDGTTAVAIGDTTSHGKVATGWTGATSAYFDSTLDTATSLGLSAWETGGDFYRPVNGGRVVKWIDSSGAIKTSVNMMPPTGTAVGAASDAALPTSHAWTTVYQPKLSSTTIDHSQAEVAKTFHWREFGNGAANGGAGATYADASMINTGDDIAYVMDDGLTSFVGYEVLANQSSIDYNIAVDATKQMYTIFIGTGLSVKRKDSSGGSDTKADTIDGVAIRSGSQTATTASRLWGWETLAQNLPYGTHIWKHGPNSGNSFWRAYEQFSFHQPKMPPIPEDAVVLADYMLMADFVKQTDAEHTQISKGVRYCNGSRDHFCDGSGAPASNVLIKSANTQWGLTGGSSNASTTQSWELPFFGTTGLSLCEDSTQSHVVELGGSATTETALDNSFHDRGDAISIAETVTLGSTSLKTTMVAGSRHFSGHLVATPIHTSSHYQTFETPFLHELVGGDRNMEQTNLVVTPDGKSWDEVTRDTSYIGINSLLTTTDTNETVGATGGKVEFDEWRGIGQYKNYNNKDFAIAYDRVICLRDGWYTSHCQNIAESSYTATSSLTLTVNGSPVAYAHTTQGANYVSYGHTHTFYVKKGDYVQITGIWYGNKDYGWWEINRATKV
jgi:hypothetical protein